jgi:hypothetical protein
MNARKDTVASHAGCRLNLEDSVELARKTIGKDDGLPLEDVGIELSEQPPSSARFLAVLLPLYG